MQKSRIYLVLALNTPVFCALVLFILPEVGLTEGLKVGVGIACHDCADSYGKRYH